MGKQKQKQAVDPQQLHLLDYHFFRSEFQSSDEYIQNPVELATANISSHCKYGSKLEDEVIGILVNASFQGVGENEEELGITAEFSIEFIFLVKNLPEFLTEDDQTQSISGILLTTLAGIAYSTSRGVIREKLNGTPFRDLLLPVVDPAELFRAE